jgi:TonB family protein
MDAVSEVLVGRSAPPGGLDRMLGASTVAHLALLAIVALVPAGWLGSRPEEEKVVMTISLGGPVGPRNGGLTPMAAKPIQALKPTEAPKAIEPVRPPAAAEPEMIQPTKTAPKKTEAPIKTNKLPDAKSRTPTTGEEIRKGSAIAETGARGQGFGLTNGGGGTGAQLDIGDFCCPEYIVTMQDLINRNWSSKQNSDAVTLMKFTIQRDGTLTGIQVERSSGRPDLDFTAQRALMLTKLPPLPPGYTNPSLGVHLTFEFQR